MSPVAIIAEDEPLLAQQLASLLARAWPELRLAGIAANGLEALALIERERPRIAFLDIRMPGLTGLEVAAELADRLGKDEAAPAIVFVTAHGRCGWRDEKREGVTGGRGAFWLSRRARRLAGTHPPAAATPDR